MMSNLRIKHIIFINENTIGKTLEKHWKNTIKEKHI
jgi:hypothetical protein